MDDRSADSTEADKIAKAHGFSRLDPIAEFSATIGPYYQKRTDCGGYVRAFVADGRHANLAGLVHGGALMSFADVVMSRALVDQAGFDVRPVTMSLNCNFLNPAKIGQWISGTATITRRARTVAFVTGMIHADDAAVMSATGVWKLTWPKNADPAA